MAKRNAPLLGLRCPLGAPLSAQSGAFRCLLLLLAFLFPCMSARAQFQQPFVFADGPNGILVFTRNDTTGVLTPVPGSPFPTREPTDNMALDFKGRFLFLATSLNNIEMYTIDPNTGALQEVPNSPFASTHTSSPNFLSTESTGQFLYVINQNGSNAFVSSVESFQIDAVNLDLIPTPAGATDLPGLFTGGATHPSGKTFYATVNNPVSNPPNQPSFILFNSSDGTFTLPNVFPSDINFFGALDPQGRYLALSTRSDQLIIQGLLSDGTLGSNMSSAGVTSVTGALGPMSFDTLGNFLYLVIPSPTIGNSPTIRFYSSSTLLESPNSPLPLGFPLPNSWVVDPTGPLIYADKVYQVDPQTGVPSPILPVNPLPQRTSLLDQTSVFSVPPGSQPIVGPVAHLSSPSLSFGSVTVGQTSSALTLTISSIGGQALALNTVAVTGANASNFSITGDTCHAPTVLQPQASCSLLISFTPSAAGVRSAALTITDDAAPPTESASLAGAGLTPAPAVTLVPGSLNFGTVTQGTSTPLNVSVTNSGLALLHISSIAVGGANPNDYSASSPSCNSAISVNSSCTITVTFAPLAPGVRSATVTLTDDAPDSPQVIDVTGNANPAFSVAAAPGSSMSATVSAGQTAQYQLQLTPSPGFTGTVSLTCSGAPLNATCQVPSTVALANGTAATFTVTVKTSGSAVFPPSTQLRWRPTSGIPTLTPLALVLLLLLLVRTYRTVDRASGRNCLAPSSALAAAIFCAIAIVPAAGCGGGSAAFMPPPVTTPPGMSSLTVTLAATSPSGQPLQLQPIRLTLTVN